MINRTYKTIQGESSTGTPDARSRTVDASKITEKDNSDPRQGTAGRLGDRQ